MPLYRNADRVVLFVHIPKTGGSTIEEVLNNSGAAQALKYHKRLGFSNSTPQHIDWSVMRFWVPADFYDYAFAVVRNPISRLISEYRWRGTLSQSPLPKFNTWVNKQLDRYPENNYLHDNHIRPQAEFVGPDVEVFRLEDGLEAPIRAGLQRLGLPLDDVPIHHARKSEHQPLSLTRPTMKRIHTFYNIDFKNFFYDAEDLPNGLTLTNPTKAAKGIVLNKAY